ncbi:hypothetical protein [Streptomyces sp. NPDC057686]
MLKPCFVRVAPTRVAGHHALAELLGPEKALVEDGDFNARPDRG